MTAQFGILMWHQNLTSLLSLYDTSAPASHNVLHCLWQGGRTIDARVPPLHASPESECPQGSAPAGLHLQNL